MLGKQIVALSFFSLSNSNAAAPLLAQFDPSMLHGSAAQSDISMYQEGNPVFPGPLTGDVYLNDHLLGRQTLTYVAGDNPYRAQVCLSSAELKTLGVKSDAHGEATLLELAPVGMPCAYASSLSLYATADYDTNQQTHRISLPQVLLDNQDLRAVDVNQADPGITALRSNYFINGYNNRRNGVASTSASLFWEQGLNLGQWRIRSSANGNYDENNGSTWQTNQVYAQTDLVALKSQLTVGETFTSGTYLDSYPLTGVVMSTHTGLLSPSERSYAPILTGIANSNARVVVMQNGYQVYEANVAPGPFVLDQITPYGYGDLETQIHEANGEVRTFTTPYNSSIGLISPGTVRYNAATGRLRGNAWFAPLTSQFTLDYGVSNALTVYGGALLANNYASTVIGGKLMTLIGSFALDTLLANTRLQGTGNSSGYSVGAKYSRDFRESGTNLNLAAYRYSSSGFWSFNDAVSAETAFLQGGSPPSKIRDRLDVTARQSLGERWGNVNVNFSRLSYRGNAPQLQYQLSYGNSVNKLFYSVNVMRSMVQGVASTYIGLNLSMSLNEGKRSVSSFASRDGSGTRSAQVSLNGTTGDARQFSYALSSAGGMLSSTNTPANLSLSGNYAHTYGTNSASYFTSADTQQTTLSANGGFIVHGGGITFGQPLSDTVALVKTENLAGAHMGYANIDLSDDGYVIVPSLQPYSRNILSIAPEGLSLEHELVNGEQHVIARSGAVVPVLFAATIKKTAIFQLTLPDGSPLPFGSWLYDEAGNMLGIVGQNGEALLRGIQTTGRLIVRSGRPCLADYDLSQAETLKVGGQDLLKLTSVCFPQVDEPAQAPELFTRIEEDKQDV